MTSRVFDVNNRPPGGMPMESAMQNIASAAHARGAVTVSSGVFKEIPARDLMIALRGALTKSQTNPEKLERIQSIIRTVAARLMQPGPVQIAASLLGQARSYAGLLAAAPKAKRARR